MLSRAAVKRAVHKKMIRTVSLFLMIGLLSFLPVTVFAQQWTFAVDSKNTYYFIDSDNILTGSRNVTFWVMKIDINTGEVKSTKECTINCRDETVAVREVLKRGLFGDPESTSFEHRLEWYEIHANSVTEDLEKIVCSKGRPREDLRDYLSSPYARDLGKTLPHGP